MENLARIQNADLNTELDSIRSSIRKCTSAGCDLAHCPPVDFIEQGNLLLGHLENWLLDDEQKQVLGENAWASFFLAASAYLCDIGLMDGNGEPSISDVPNTTFCNNLCLRSYDWIRRNWQDLGIADASAAEIIAVICLRMDDPSNTNHKARNPQKLTFGDAGIDAKMLGTFLRLSKALELKAFTTSKEIDARLHHGKKNLTESLNKHYNVLAIGPHPYFPATIRVKIRCRHPEIHRALKHHERSVQQQLNDFNQRIRPRFFFSDVVFEIEPTKYQPIDLKFNVDSSAALQLFMGNRLYSDKRVFLRELIQNAVDACNMCKLADTDTTYSPRISITFNQDISIVTIRDNGIGMDRHWIEKYFLSIGISFYQSDEIRGINRDSHIDIGFISQFGIGFLSSFLVADKIVIKTRKKSSPGLMITITNLRDYFDVRPLGNDEPVGTEVTLHLKKSKINYCRSLEYVGYLKSNIRFLQIPVKFRDEQGNTTFLGNQPLSYADEKRYASDFVAPLNFESSEGYLLLGAKMNVDHIFALDTAKGGVSIFQDGIFVIQLDSLLPEGARANVVGRINLKGEDKCELSMDRNRIFWTSDQKKRIRMLIRHALVDVASQLMNAMDEQDVPLTTRNSIINHLAIFFDFSDVDDPMHKKLCPPIRKIVEKRFRDFVRIHFAHTLRREGIPEADGYNERWQQKILESYVHKT
jgi:Histidine kinase-, DNA gyrase B-, and HSP90-like ATPase